MQNKYAGILLLISCIVLVLAAGCTGTSSTTSTPVTVQTTAVNVIPTPTPASTTIYTGSGNEEKTITISAPCTMYFDISYTGTNKFKVWLEDGVRNQIKIFTDQTGAYSGTSSIPLTPGTYYLDIQTDGSWTVSTRIA